MVKNTGIKSSLISRIVPVGTDGKNKIDAIIGDLINVILVSFSAIGFPLMAACAIYLFPKGHWKIYLCYLIIYFVLIGITVFRKKLSVQKRALFGLSTCFLLSVIVMLRVGLLGAGPYILFTFSLITTIYFGTRAGILSALIGLATIGIVGFMALSGLIHLNQDIIASLNTVSSWFLGATIFAVFTLSMVLCLGMLKNRLQNTVESFLEQTERLDTTNRQLTDEIKKREAVQEELEKEEKNYRRLMTYSTDVIWTMDMNLHFTYVSPSVEKLFGYTMKQALTNRLEDIMPPSSLETVLCGIRDGITSQAGMDFPPPPLSFEVKQFRSDGSLLWTEITVSLIRLPTDEEYYFQGVTRDISKRKQAEETLRESEGRFREITESSQDMLYRQEFNTGVFDYVSPAVKHVLGHTPEELMSMSLDEQSEAIHPDDLPRLLHFRDDLLEADTSEKRFIGRKFQMKNKAGQYRWIHGNYQLTKDAKGAPRFIVGALRDITDRKQAEQTLRESEAKYRTLYHSTTDAIMLLDKESFFDCNDETLNIFGCDSKEDFIDKHPNNFSPEKQPDGQNSMVASGKRIESAFQVGRQHFEWLHCRKDKTVFPAEVSLTAMEIGGKTVLQAVVRDITDRKQAEEALRKSEERLRTQFKKLPIPAYVWRRIEDDFILISYNDAGREITDGKIPDFIGKTAREMYGKQPDILRYMRECYDERKAIRKEHAYRFVSTGRDSFLYVTYTFVLPDLLVVYTEDITERHNAEHELRESRNELEALLNATTDFAILLDVDGKLSAVNESFAKRFNVVPEEAKGKYLRDFISGPVLMNRMKRAREAIESSHPVTFRDEREGLQYETTFFPVRNDEGEVVKAAGFGRDITEKSLSAKALEDSEKRYRLLVEDISEGIGIVDLDDRFVFINPAGAKIFGCSVDEMVGRSLDEFLDSKHRIIVGEQNDLRLKGMDSRYELEIVRSDGSRRSMVVNAAPKRNVDGKIIGTQGFFADITEQKRTREAARKSASEMKALFNATKDIAFLIDTEGKILASNEKMAESFALDIDNVIMENLHDLLPEDLSDLCAVHEKKVIESRMPDYFDTYRDDRHFYISIYPVFDDDGVVSKLAIFGQDLTEEEAVRKKLLEIEKQYQTVVETSSDAIVIIQDGKIVYGNPGLTEMLDYPMNELMGMEFLRYIHENDHEKIFGLYMRYIGGEREMGIFHLVALRRDGSLINIDLDAGMLTYKGRDALLATCRDVTDKKKAEQALRDSEARLQLALRAVNEGVWDWNLITRKMYFSPRFYAMLEYDPGDLAQSFDSWMGLIHSADRAEVEKTIRRHIPQKDKMFSIEFRMRTKTRKWKWILGRGMAVEHDDDGNPMRMVGTHIDISEQKIAETRLMDYQSRLQSLAFELVSTETRERKGIATALHDGICQLLASAQLHLSVPEDPEAPEERDCRLKKAKDIIDMAFDSARTLTYELAPPILYELGFEKAIVQYLGKMRSDFKIDVTCTVSGERNRLERSQDELLYRSVRELLMNVIKHARADNVAVTVKRLKKSVKIEVDDDGIGCEGINDIMAHPNENQGFGIFSINEQLNNVGGRLTILSKARVGTKVFIELPLNLQATRKRGRK
jgi:PAS domain S-box-containing protein